jgi:hypothetical protein
MYTKEQVEQAVKSLGYKWYEKGDFNLNIVGIRNSSTGKKVTNRFDDTICVSYKENGEWKHFSWAITTDNGEGSARLVEWQYTSCFMVRKHRGLYDALCQYRPLRVYRDFNLKDGTYDESKIYTDAQGINIHMAGEDSNFVNNWSEGCQVFKRKKDFLEFMKIVKKSLEFYPNSFTYTLIGSKDIKI